MSSPSVVCLSSVTLLHPTYRIELFGNIFAHLIVQARTRTVCIKMLEKFEGGLGDMQVKWKGV